MTTAVQSRSAKRVLLLTHYCWAGLSGSFVLVWLIVITTSVRSEFVTAQILVGLCGLIATGPSLVHYLRLVIRSRWSIQSNCTEPLRLFW